MNKHTNQLLNLEDFNIFEFNIFRAQIEDCELIVPPSCYRFGLFLSPVKPYHDSTAT